MSEPSPDIAPPPAWDGCLWPVDPACMQDDWAAADPDIRLRAQRMMTETMRMLTGWTVGGCPVTVRPVLQPVGCGAGYERTLGLDGTLLFRSERNDPREVRLPAPVGGIVRVLVDGVVVDPTGYQLQNGNVLTWIGGGEQPWPVTQDALLPDSEPGTFSVTYLNAYPVDANGQWAGGIMAMEYLRACISGAKAKCRLPSTVRSIARAGVSFEIPAGAFPEGLTGIREVDSYLQSVKPNVKAQYASAIYSPDRPLPRVVPTSVPLEA